ncbi:hypothetical protein [Paenibacillus barengoltzii]|uniref:hypothetical protein n=1 Tax=Paenibacillus barengoltzii TaxID=343517 RepID=UPI0013E04AFA|nr:hypothetical protein [Paenibacillus barengoltzii]
MKGERGGKRGESGGCCGNLRERSILQVAQVEQVAMLRVDGVSGVRAADAG